MIAYKFDISRITQRIKDYLKRIDCLFFLNDFREYLLLELINEFELPINIARKNIPNPSFHVFKYDLLNSHFHDFACTYSNIYRDLTTILNDNIWYGVESMVVNTNILTLKVRNKHD